MLVKATRMAALSLFALALTSVGAAAGPAAEETQPAAPVAAEAGMRAYVDPASGQITGQPVTAEQQRTAESADPAFRQDDAGLQIVYFEDGSSMMDLQGRFQQATVAERQADGRLTTWCNDADHLDLGKHRHGIDDQPASVAPARDER